MQQTTLPDGFGRRWVEAIHATFDETASLLGDLDRRSGDGDFGDNISAALRRARAARDARPTTGYADELGAVSTGFLGTGGTSGPLFGMFFRELSRCASGAEPTLAELGAGLAQGVATVQRYGRAEVGHKTMVDSLAPAADSLAGAGDDAGEALALAADAAVAGAASTAEILARRGRASYVGEVSRGVPDPGAVAGALFVQAAAAALAPGGVVDTRWVHALTGPA